MRIRRAHQSHVEHAFKFVIVDEFAISAQKPVFFLASQGLPCPRLCLGISCHFGLPALRAQPSQPPAKLRARPSPLAVPQSPSADFFAQAAPKAPQRWM